MCSGFGSFDVGCAASGCHILHADMDLAELNLLSGLWQILIIHERESGWPVHDLMALCRQLVHDEKLASYLEPNAVDKFRRFLLKQHYYFQYDMKQDSVSIAMDSPTAASERWLVKYLALHILQGGCGEVGEDASAKCQLALPKCITSHLNIVYGGSLELLCKTHPLRFILDRNGAHLAQLTADCYEEVVAGLLEEEDLVYFFVDLLHKIGTTELKPCPVHTLTKYLPFMSSKDRKLLKESYSDNLSLFFLLNTENFVMTRVEKGSVYLKHRDPHYAAALFLRQQLNIQGKPDVSLCELVLRAKYASSSLTQYLFVAETAETEVRQIVLSHPALFRLSDTGEKLQLRNEIPTGARWDADAELLATAYFIDVLKDISATSPSRAICFNYIIHAASSAPPKCKGHLSSFYPGVEVIGLFHLHPGIFDLSSVNRVSLHTTEQPEMLATQPRSEQAIKKQAVEYAAKLLKYVCHLTPDLFLSCTEALPGEIRQYCWAPVRGRSQSIIKSGRAALAANSLRTGMTATSEASTQTINERTSEPLMCQPANEATEKEEGTERINQKGATIADNEIKRIDPAPALHEANAAEPCVLKAQPDVVSTNNASNGGCCIVCCKVKC
ncbi:hypothetical protein HPB50_028952 [Hyalomma asiaticum]|nr:hypothetical protein HPB50_028952 [Hyalomma asiaticum]